MRIFLSYSRADAGLADKIAHTLRQAGHKVFFDQYGIQAAEDFYRIIWSEIQKTDLFVFLISPDSIQSGSYALTELGFAEKKWPNPEGHVLPVVVEPTDLAAAPLYASICRVVHPKGNPEAEVRAEVNKLSKRHRLAQIRRAVAFAVALASVGLAGMWAYQGYLDQQPIEARIELAAREIPFDANRFVESAYQGELQAVDLFLKANMKPDAGSADKLPYPKRSAYTFGAGTTALMAAAAGGRMMVVQRLLEAGAQVDLGEKDGASALFWAAEMGQVEVVRLLLEFPTTSKSVDAAFEAAVDNEILRLLLSPKYDVSGSAIDRAFVSAAGSGDLERFELLADRVSDKPRIASFALLEAARRLSRKSKTPKETRLEVFELLFAMGADVNVQVVRAGQPGYHLSGYAGFTALLDAVSGEYPDLVQLLLKQGADPNKQCECKGHMGGGWTPLTLAIRGSTVSNQASEEIVSHLLAHGADVNLATVNPWAPENSTTPLVEAAKENRIDIVNTLLREGAKVNQPDGKGLTPLYHAAANKGGSEMVELLLAKDADVRASQDPLFNVVRNGNQRIAEMLLESGADINAKSRRDGQTPLMRAVQKGDRDMVRFLLASGASVAIEDELGRTAELFAQRGESNAIIELVRRGAE